VGSESLGDLLCIVHFLSFARTRIVTMGMLEMPELVGQHVCNGTNGRPLALYWDGALVLHSSTVVPLAGARLALNSHSDIFRQLVFARCPLYHASDGG